MPEKKVTTITSSGYRLCGATLPEPIGMRRDCVRCKCRFIFLPWDGGWQDREREELRLCDSCYGDYRAAEDTLRAQGFSKEKKLFADLHAAWDKIAAYRRDITINGFEFSVCLRAEGDLYEQHMEVWSNDVLVMKSDIDKL
jgi:hypothetical protein